LCEFDTMEYIESSALAARSIDRSVANGPPSRQVKG
jgi:hypothetical protein